MSNAIVCERLSKTYGKTVALTDVDLAVETGEVMGFLGANGAGKTTTLRCLVGLLRPSGGQARVLGLDPIRNHKQLAARIGYLPGELRLYPDLTGDEHLDLLARLQGARSHRKRDLCERLLLSSKDLARPIRDYSRGMKQKVGLVQAFQHDPELVFLDEPTEGLDPIVQEAFFDILSNSRTAGKTVFLSSHVLSEVQKTCSRVAVIKSGRLETVSSVEALRGARSRRLRVRFRAGTDAAQVPVDEKWKPVWSDSDLTLSVEPAEVVPVLRQLLTHDVDDVLVEEASLDEAVLALYTGGNEK